MTMSERARHVVDDAAPEDDPLLQVLAAAPADVEPLTPEDEAALAEAYEALERGDVIAGAEVRRRLGLE